MNYFRSAIVIICGLVCSMLTGQTVSSFNFSYSYQDPDYAYAYPSEEKEGRFTEDIATSKIFGFNYHVYLNDLNALGLRLAYEIQDVKYNGLTYNVGKGPDVNTYSYEKDVLRNFSVALVYTRKLILENSVSYLEFSVGPMYSRTIVNQKQLDGEDLGFSANFEQANLWGFWLHPAFVYRPWQNGRMKHLLFSLGPVAQFMWLEEALINPKYNLGLQVGICFEFLPDEGA